MDASKESLHVCASAGDHQKRQRQQYQRASRATPDLVKPVDPDELSEVLSED
jgi:hypothetical protein